MQDIVAILIFTRGELYNADKYKRIFTALAMGKLAKDVIVERQGYIRIRSKDLEQLKTKMDNMLHKIPGDSQALIID